MPDLPDENTPAAARLGPLAGSDTPEPPRPSGRRRVAVVLAALLVAAGTAALVIGLVDRKQERDVREAAESRQVVAAEKRRLSAIQAPHRAAARALRPAAGASRAQQIAARTALLDAARRSILLDARGRAQRGELDGPIRAVTCTPYDRDPKAVPDHLQIDHTVGRYDCIAIQRSDIEGIALGHPFVAALDFNKYTYVWCRNTPPPSERGESLAYVRLDRACLAARGRPLGTGYALTPAEKQGD